MPASMVGAGSYLGALAIQKKNYTYAYTLIKEARAGEGKKLNKVNRKINQKLGTDISLDSLAQAIVAANNDNVFCELNESTEKVNLMGYHKMLKHLNQEVRAGL